MIIIVSGKPGTRWMSVPTVLARWEGTRGRSGRDALREICCISLSRLLELDDTKLDTLLGGGEEEIQCITGLLFRRVMWPRLDNCKLGRSKIVSVHADFKMHHGQSEA